MKTRNKLKIHFLRMLIIGIVLYFSAFMISSLVESYFSPLSVTKRINSEIASALSDLNSEIEKIQKQNFLNEAEFQKFIDKNYKNAFSEEGIEILIYRNDSLKWWSDNIFAAPLIKDTENFLSEIVHSGSGYYLVKQKPFGNYNIVALQLIRYDYKYLNEYLPKTFHEKFSAPANAEINLQKGEYKVTDPEGKYLFSLNYEQPFEMGLWLQYLIFTLYISSFLCLISASYVIYMFAMRDFGKKWFLFLVFVVDVIIVRAIQFYFKFPADLYSLQIFNPTYYASSVLLPSLGDFLIHILLGVQLVFFASKNSLPLKKYVVNKPKGWILPAALFIAFILVLIYFLTPIISNLVLDSTISFRFENILSLSHISHIGMIILALILFGFLLLVEMIGKQISKLLTDRKHLLLIAFSGLLLYSIITYFNTRFDIFDIIFAATILSILALRSDSKETNRLNVTRIVSVSILLAVFATYLLNKAEIKRESEKRKLLATQLSNARDNLAEYYYNEAVKNLRKDTNLKRILTEEQTENVLKETTDYIKDNYFSGYWNKYLVQITICQPDKKLNIMPGNIITGCETYFEAKIKQYMRPVSIPGLFFLRQSVDSIF